MNEAAPARPAATQALPALTLLFLGCSFDSFAVVTAFFADSAGEHDDAVALGAFLSFACLVGAGLLLSHATAAASGAATQAAVRLERLAPLALIASGVYILADTPTDVL